MFQKGFGVEKDIVQVLNWYSKAAKLGHVQAREQLAKIKSEHSNTDAKAEQERQEVADQSQGDRLTSVNYEKKVKETE